MKPRHWLFVVSILLFAGGMVFLVAAARASRAAQPAAEVPLTSVATVKQVMNGIVAPAAKTVYDAVGMTIDGPVMKEWAPKTDAEWEAVGNGAAAIVESGNLLLIGSRKVDDHEWVRLTRMMIDGGKEALAAVQAKNADQLLAAGEPINNSCDMCHDKYAR